MPTDASAPLPDLNLEQKAVLQLDTGDPNCIITGLVIHVSQTIPELPQPPEKVAPLLGYVPQGAT